MDDRVAAALEDAFPERAVESVGSTGPSWNETNRTVRVAFADGAECYLKVDLAGDGASIARERAAIGYVGANRPVGVPEVVASSTDGIAYLATAPVSGPTLHEVWRDASADERAELLSGVGAAIAALHGPRLEDHGHVTGGGPGGLDLETGSWTTILGERIEAMRSLAPADRFDPHFDRVLEAVEAHRDLLDGAPAALVHGDPARPNCFWGDRGVGFLDWEIAHVGDPARELHRARNQQIAPLRGRGPDRLVEALHEGYRAEAGGLPWGFDDRCPIYDAVRFLGVSGFFENYAEFADEPTDEFAEWVGREMDRRLTRLPGRS